jgi:branched-chain amino acid transport system permease protein
MIESIVTNTLNGIYYGAVLFMIASGLTVIFGILGVLNFAHGELYAFGAYIGVTVIGTIFDVLVSSSSNALFIMGLFIVGVLITASALIPLGYIIEVILLRRIYNRAEYYQLLLTFAILLTLTGVIKFIWGSSPVTNPAPYQSLNSISLLGAFGWSYPSYNIIVILFATVTFLTMLWFFNNTKRGRIIRATAINKQMATAIGVETERTFTIVFIIGTFLAGLGGALAAPPIAATLGMGLKPLVLAFVVIVIGGIGSIHGSFVASMIVGIMSRWSIQLYPPAELAAPFIIMIIVLIVKQDGIFKSWGEIR